MHILLTILILILVVGVSDIIKRSLPFNVPLPLLQIILGALIAWPDSGLHVNFDPELFLVLFIPPLLFADGRKMPLHEFLEGRREILSLAMVLVFITVVGLGYLIHYIIPAMPLVVAFALAAVLSPTDAVALSGIVGKGRLPKAMMQVLEGEALMNDASALVSLKFAVAIAMGTMAFSTLHDYSNVGLTFLKMAAGGIIIGIVVTWCYIKMIRSLSRWRENDPATQMIFFLLLPFVVYVIAEHLQTSGILAAVAAGMMVGQSNVINTAPLTMRLRANSVWSLLEFILNGTVFLMLGLQIPGIVEYSIDQIRTDDNMTMWLLFSDVFLIYFALMALRFIWLWIMKTYSNLFLKKRPLRFGAFSTKGLLIATFAGVRGAITLAAALSIPLFISASTPFPARYQVIFLSVGVIILSLLVGVILLPLLLRGVSIDRSVLIQEEKDAKMAMAKAGITALHTLEERVLTSVEEPIDPQLVANVIAQVSSDIQRYNNQQEDMDISDTLERRFRLAALRSQRGELYRLKASKEISEETLNKLIYEIDLMETLLVGRENRSH